ncbi:hypothetical protein KA005_26995, partial [bacterium]|nr:hypothetical protein [bacterium]
ILTIHTALYPTFSVCTEIIKYRLRRFLRKRFYSEVKKQGQTVISIVIFNLLGIKEILTI